MEIFTLTPMGIWITALLAILVVSIIAALGSALLGSLLAEKIILSTIIAGLAIYIVGIPVLFVLQGVSITLFAAFFILIIAFVGILVAQVADLIFGY